MPTLKTLDEIFLLEGGKKPTGDAVEADVLSGKGFSNATGVGKIGTMPNQGQKIITPGTANIAIPAGYHNGSGYVVGDPDLVTDNIKAGANIFGVVGKASVVDTADATAVAGDILSSKTAYVNGSKLTGTMTNRGAYNITPGASNVTIPAGYHNGAGVVYGDADLVASNIKRGINIFGIAGSCDPILGGVVFLQATATGVVKPVAWEAGYQSAPGSVNLNYNLVGDVCNFKVKFDFTGSGVLTAVTSTPVDLTNIKTLVALMWPNGSSLYAYLVASTDKSSSYNVYNAMVQATNKYYPWYMVLNVSTLSGSYYLRMHYEHTAGGTTAYAYSVIGLI